MGETLTAPVPTETTEDSLEARMQELDRVLTSLVSANANVIVRCPWLGDAEVTLSEALRAYPKPMIEEDPNDLVAMVMNLIANRVEKTEEAEDSKAEEEEDALEPENDPAKNEDNDQPDEELQPPTEQAKSDKSSEAKPGNDQPMPKAAEVGQSKTENNQPDELLDNELDMPASARPAQTKAAENGKTAGTVKNEAPITVSSGRGLNSPVRIQAAGPSKAAEAAKTDVNIVPKNEKPDSAKEQIPDTANQQPRTDYEKQSDTEAVGLTELEIENEIILEDETIIIENETQTIEDGTETPTLDYRIEVDEPEDLETDETFIDGLAEAELELDEIEAEEIDILLVPDKSLLEDTEIVETAESEQSDQIEPEETEDLLINLAERIETAEPETAQIATELLDLIDEAVSRLNIDDGENVLTEIEIQAELEELFTELFESLGIEYTPELIESLARLTIQTRLIGEIEKLDEEEYSDEPADTGTHEVIKDLLRGINTIQKAKAYAGVIGKSAIKLYYSNRALVEYLTR